MVPKTASRLICAIGKSETGHAQHIADWGAMMPRVWASRAAFRFDQNERQSLDKCKACQMADINLSPNGSQLVLAC
jgi:hypothetical protein